MTMVRRCAALKWKTFAKNDVGPVRHLLKDGKRPRPRGRGVGVVRHEARRRLGGSRGGRAAASSAAAAVSAARPRGRKDRAPLPMHL